MRYLSPNPLFQFLAVLAIVTSLHPITVLALPTDIQSPPPSSPNHAASPLHLPAVLPIPKHSPTIQNRAITTYYDNLGPWRMALTAVSFFYANYLNTIPVPSSKMAHFFADIASQASAHVSAHDLGQTSMFFGEGAVSLAFILRDGVGAEGITVPWDLVAQLAGEFAARAVRGNPTAFRARVDGPLGKNMQGTSPWIEVVLTVGESVLDGIKWSIY